MLAQLNSSLPSMTRKANGLLNNTNGVMVEAKHGIADARSTVKGAHVLMTSLNDKVKCVRCSNYCCQTKYGTRRSKQTYGNTE